MSDEQLNRAENKLRDAQERADKIQTNGRRLAAGWRRSREANNFRQLLRTLGGGDNGQGVGN